MRRIDIVRHLDRTEQGRRHQERVVAFLDELAVADGARPLSDHLWLDLVGGGAPGFVAVTASGLTAGAARLDGMAQVSAANNGVVLEVVTRPAHDIPDAEAVAIDLADTAIDTVRRHGGGRLTWWVDHATTAVDELAARQGLALERALHEMRVPLPHPDRSAVETRAFVPGVDDAAWLAVNNRAFADHGEQGDWTDSTLALRIAEPWFDAAGFRLHEDDGRLVGFCWTKVHADSHPPIGEIYAIAVDPDAHGRGLGRELTLAGLDSLADRGIGHANLYVDAANESAFRLYERLGFTVHRTRSAYSGRLDRS